MKVNRRSQDGFTMMELIISMTMISIVVTILAGTFVTSADIFKSTVKSGDDISELRLATGRINLELRSIRDDKSVTEAKSSKIKFVNSDGNSVDINFNPGSSKVTLNGKTLAVALSSFQLKYLDKSGNYIGNPTTKPQTNIWSIEVELVTSGMNSMKMVSRVYPRNFM